MSIRFANDAGSLDRVRRTIGNAQAFPAEEFSVVWAVYHHIRTTTQYQTYFVVADDIGFTGANEYCVAFAGIAAIDLHFAIGSQGADTYHASAQPAIGQWYYQVFRRRKRAVNDYEQLYYPNLPDESIVISKDMPAAITFTGTTSVNFGSVPYINNEGIDGSMSNMWIFNGALPIPLLAQQARTRTLLPSIPRDRVWGNWPCDTQDRLLDVSGYGRHLSLSVDAGNGFKSWANAPLIQDVTAEERLHSIDMGQLFAVVGGDPIYVEEDALWYQTVLR